MAKRLEFIRRELERLESQTTSLAEKQGRKQQQVRSWSVEKFSRMAVHSQTGSAGACSTSQRSGSGNQLLWR